MPVMPPAGATFFEVRQSPAGTPISLSWLKAASACMIVPRSPASIAAFAAAKLLEEGLRRAGRDLDRRKLVDALEELYGYETGLTPPLSYGPNRRIGFGEHLPRTVAFVENEHGLVAAPASWTEGPPAELRAAQLLYLAPDWAEPWVVRSRLAYEASFLASSLDELGAAFDRGIATAEKKGDVQAAKEMRVFLKRLEKVGT